MSSFGGGACLGDGMRGLRARVCLHRREHVLARVYSYLSSMSRACTILSVASLVPPQILTLFHKRYDFREKKLLNIKRVSIFSLQLLFEIFLILRRN